MENPTFDELRANARALKRHLDEVTPFLSLSKFGHGFDDKTLYHSYAAEFDEILVCAIKLAYQFGSDNFAAQKILEITPAKDFRSYPDRIGNDFQKYRIEMAKLLGRYLELLSLPIAGDTSQA